MHEGTVAQGVIDLLEGELAARRLNGPVTSVTVRAGRLRSIVPDSLRLFFDVIKRDHRRLAAARLLIEEVPLKVRCGPCAASFEIDEPIFLCRRCGGPVQVESGQELCVTGFTIDDNEEERRSYGDPHRTEGPRGE